jgi:L-threonylcarbamoyladenylate synthase
MIIKLSSKNLNETVKTAISVLEKGGIVAYPTETFYGLGVKYDMEPALKRLYEIKKRPREKTMPLIIGNIKQLSLLTHAVNDSAWKFIKKYWPGPLTIIFRARSGLSEYIVSGGKIAVRIPGESFALKLARAAGFPLTATSANISGRPPADSAQMILDYFNHNLDLIVDGGMTESKLPSTIVDATEKKIKILRKGLTDIQLQ